MKNLLLNVLIICMLATGFASCSSDDDEPWVEPQFTTTGIYILNSGKKGDNNANLGYYDISANRYTEDVFSNQNNKLKIGDTGNDMAIYGSKMYILATNSNQIFITDLKAKVLKYNDGNQTIINLKNEHNEPESPRFVTAHSNKVYISLETGYVARIDTTTMLVDGRVKVGSNPEGMAVVNNKLYVANSGYGYGNTVSVVDLNTFSENKKIDVATNPCYIISDKNNNLYISSWGRTWGGANIKPQIQKLNPATEEITILGTDIGSYIRLNKDEDKLFLIKEIWDENWNSTCEISYYDIKNNQHVTTPYFTMPEIAGLSLSNAFSISVDPISGDLYISTSDYRTNGDMYIFSADGKYKASFDTGGINPMGVYFLTSTK